MTDPTPPPIPKVPTGVWVSAILTCLVLVVAGLFHGNETVWVAGLGGLAGLGVIPRN
jgi:hypothetical protein